MKSEFHERNENENIVNPLKVKEELTLNCKHCDEPLMKIVVMERKGTVPIEWNIFARCFACSSRSKTVKILGQYAYAGILDGDKELTSVEEVEINDDETVAFRIKKVQ